MGGKGGRKRGRRRIGGAQWWGNQLSSGSLLLIRWRLISRVERGKFWSQEGIRKRIWLVLRLV
jgi:hypothetical protein